MPCQRPHRGSVDGAIDEPPRDGRCPGRISFGCDRFLFLSSLIARAREPPHGGLAGWRVDSAKLRCLARKCADWLLAIYFINIWI